MKKTGILLLVCVLLLAGCAPAALGAEGESYRQIDQETAMQMMESGGSYVIVDVRRPDEYVEGHIPGAICIPNESIGEERPEELPNPGQTILVYCRSGNRSKQAAEKLAGLGYTEVFEFGGILDWTGETVKGQTLVLTLESNPTTGFTWAAEQDGELLDVQSFYVAEPHEQPLVGGGGWQSFLLIPKAPGTAKLSFTYARPWETHDTDARFGCSFEIAEDLSITVIGDGAEAASALGYMPTIRIYG